MCGQVLTFTNILLHNGMMFTKDALQNMTNNWYANWWVYAEADNSEICLVYPQGQYSNASSAEAEAPPTEIPVHVSEHGILLGRILFKKSTDVPIEVQSSFTTTFNAAQAADHGNLAGLGDDDHSIYYLDTDVSSTANLVSELSVFTLDTDISSAAQLETEMEAVLDLEDLQGTATIGQLPANLTSGVQMTTDLTTSVTDAITEGSLDDQVITGADIKDDTVDSNDYAPASIDNEHLADNAVDLR